MDILLAALEGASFVAAFSSLLKAQRPSSLAGGATPTVTAARLPKLRIEYR